MLAVDTNVVVRLLTKDDAVQARVARKLIEDHDILLLSTVMLEVEWVLRSLYAFPPKRVHAGLTAFVGIGNVTSDEPKRTAQALDWFKQGMDFADAMHLAGSDDCQSFATFDHKLAVAARKAKAGKVKTL